MANCTITVLFYKHSLNSVSISVPIYLKSKQAKGWAIHLQACSLSLDFECEAVVWTLWLENFFC